ncbi:MAG: tRNA1(Val) (adenine(37)-N6)-methyltransferase [Bacteroidales bacterium]
MAFRFRQFAVEDSRSTLRVGTDSMLLGSWADPKKAKTILDIGTGCGVLSLMMAQKSKAMIEAIEIDEPSVVEAAKNFQNSPWAERISIVNTSLQKFAIDPPSHFDFIVTNPPYFSNSLKSPSERVNQSRHDDTLSLDELVHHAARLISDEGRFALILPFGQTERLLASCEKSGLFLSRRIVVHSKYGSPPKRAMLEFTQHHINQPDGAVLTILGDDGKFTPEYLALTKGFHNF